MSKPQFIRFGREVCAEPWPFNPVIEPDGSDGPLVRNPLNSGLHPYRLRFRMRGESISPDHIWDENFDQPVETEHGLPCRDHHLCIGECPLNLINGEWSGLTARQKEKASPYIEEAMQRFFAMTIACGPTRFLPSACRSVR